MEATMQTLFNTNLGKISLGRLVFGVIILWAWCANASALSWQAKDFSDIKGKEETRQILIIGANGSVAKVATQGFLSGTNAKLKLFLRDSKRLAKVAQQNPQRVQLIEGNALDKELLKKAMSGADVVYANLAGDLPKMASAIIQAMKEAGLKRLIWVGSFGVYAGEIPKSEEDRIRAYLPPHREAVRIIEASGLDYSIIRAEWFSNADEIDYELTRKGEAFKNPSGYISRKSIAHLVIRLCLEKDFGVRESFGINKPAK